jgi:hypothetical protein
MHKMLTGHNLVPLLLDETKDSFSKARQMVQSNTQKVCRNIEIKGPTCCPHRTILIADHMEARSCPEAPHGFSTICTAGIDLNASVHRYLNWG